MNPPANVDVGGVGSPSQPRQRPHSRDRRPATTPRRRGRPATDDTEDKRAAILDAARVAFAARGYDGASVRAIAAAAGVDPALVHHYFGTKEHVFVEAMNLPIDPSVVIPQILAGPRGQLGERIVRFFLSVWESEEGRVAILALMRSAVTHEQAALMLRQFVTRAFLRPLAGAVGPAEDADLRASLVGSQLIGLAMLRLVVRVEPLATASQEDVVALVAPDDPAVPHGSLTSPPQTWTLESDVSRHIGLQRPHLPLTGRWTRLHIHPVMNYAIEVDGLVVDRGGRRVLDDVSFTVAPGEVVGLLGPSGCGKSTLMRALVGVQIVKSGRVEALGQPAGSADLRRRVGYMTQSPSVYADLSVRANLRYFATIVGAPRSDADRVMDEVDLASHADALVGRLSGGQLSRVSLATALLGSPELLVLDEPTVGLDPVLRRDLWNLFNRLAATGVTLLVSSHVMDEASRCTRLLLMREGQILADDSPAGLLSHTAAPDVGAAFLQLVDAAAARDRSAA